MKTSTVSAARWLLGAVTVLGPLGCLGTGKGTYGQTARYSPSYRGYVVTAKRESEDTVPGAPDVLLLRDPLTQEKLRCLEDLSRWMPAQGRGADVNVRMEGSVRNTGIIMSPFLLTGFVVGGALLLVGMSPHLLAHPASGENWYDRGIDAFRQHRYADASRALETSLSSSSLGDHTHRSYALYYLGLSYEQLRQDDLAREALTAFVRRADVANAMAFQTAEERLARLGAPIRACQSIEPVPMVWEQR